MAPTPLRATWRAHTLLPVLAIVMLAACRDESPAGPAPVDSQPLAAAAGVDVVSVVGLEPLVGALADISSASDVNDLGQVVGSSISPAGHNTAVLWDNSRFPIDLGSLGSFARASAISADGSVIVGTAGDPALGFPRPVRWVKPAGAWVIDELPMLPEAGGCEAFDVSDDGTLIAGYCTLSTGNRAVRWLNGVIRDLDPGVATAVNSQGQIAGQVRLPPTTLEAAVWSPAGDVTPLGTFSGSFSEARGIDASGTVVGQYGGGSELRPFLWTSKKGFLDLGLLAGATKAAAFAVNGAAIVGESILADGFEHPTLWQKGKIVDLGALPGYDRAIALAVNSRGTIVGFSRVESSDLFLPPATRATVWTLK